MPKRAVACVLVALLSLTGCTVKTVHKDAPPNAVIQPGKDTIVGATTMAGKEVSFDLPGATLTNNTLHGYVAKAPYDLPMDQVQRLWIQHEGISAVRTIGLIAGISVGTLAAAVGIIAATKQSCPFVYSWNGDQFVFDAEPYGGAIAKGLEKDDYAELGQLRERDGRYDLRMTNEVDETQMTNMTELWVVDHPAGSRVVPDINGRLRTVSAPQQLISATDVAGHDMTNWLRTTDRLIWEPPAVPDSNGSLQGDITMTFPRPANAREAKLVVNAATGLWGSYMIKKMVALRGKNVGRFYMEVNHSKAARNRLVEWETREEIYRLKVYVQEPTGWVVRGVLPGTGPFISKDRVLPLDVSHATGDVLRIRIHPPAGFWALNSFAVDYSADQPVSVQTIHPTRAVDGQGNDVLPILTAVDGRYLPMPNIGDSAEISFAAPAQKAGAERTVILHTRGYYKLHINPTGEPDKATLAAIEKVPGSAVKFAAAQFATWKSAQQAAQLASR